MTNSDSYTISPIARIRTDFKEKFGIPRQSGLVPELRGVIEFEPEYRNADALRYLEGYSHLWLIWGFNKNKKDGDSSWSPMIRPPRLGGKVKVGVWASRSPFRPNGLGLSAVEIVDIDVSDPDNPLIVVGGIDMLDGTPIYDIKPYITYSDSIPGANSGFSVAKTKLIDVEDPAGHLSIFEPEMRAAAVRVLEQDPRAAYDKKPGFIYGMRFADYDIKFVADNECLTVVGVVEL